MSLRYWCPPSPSTSSTTNSPLSSEFPSCKTTRLPRSSPIERKGTWGQNKPTPSQPVSRRNRVGTVFLPENEFAQQLFDAESVSFFFFITVAKFQCERGRFHLKELGQRTFFFFDNRREIPVREGPFSSQNTRATNLFFLITVAKFQCERGHFHLKKLEQRPGH